MDTKEEEPRKHSCYVDEQKRFNVSWKLISFSSSSLLKEMSLSRNQRDVEFSSFVFLNSRMS